MGERGKVKFYNSQKGFGFIIQEGREREIHFDKDSFKGNTPLEGEEVEFDVREQRKWLHAINLRIISKLPKDTRNILQDFADIDNFNLKLNKAARFIGEKFKIFKTDKGKVIYKIEANFSESMIKDISKQYYESIQKLNLKLSEPLILKPDWRMVIGLGNESVYKTSMTLHHIYGIPYIPASAIKGVVRNYIITEKFGNNEDGKLDLQHAEDRALQNQGFCDIFGCPQKSFYKESRQGKVIFFDAFPLAPPKIEPDVMDPHYGPYYSDFLGKTPPADYHTPNPIFFLTVKSTPFQFMIGIKSKDNKMINDSIFNGNILNIAREFLKNALSEHGIGAKTAVGYGYMSA